jgi:hypothetical protein
MDIEDLAQLISWIDGRWKEQLLILVYFNP